MAHEHTSRGPLTATEATADEKSLVGPGSSATMWPFAQRIAIPLWAIVVVSYAMIGFLQWLPFGWNIGPRVDGWTLLSDVDKGMHPFVFISPDLVTRPFFFWIWMFNNRFDPNDFVLLNVILMLMQILRASAMYALMRQLFGQQRLFAYLAGVLLLVFPADSATYYEGATHVLLSFTLLLVAVNFLVWYWRDRQWWQLVLALGVEVVSVGNYEIGDLLLLATPLILLWLDRRPSWRLGLTSALWFVAPAASLFVAYADVYFNPASHHSTMLDTNGVSYPQKLWNAVEAQFWTPYVQGLKDILAALGGSSGHADLAAALTIVIIVVVMVAVMLRGRWPGSETDSGALGAAHWVVLAAVGFGAMLLGIALFLPSDQLDSFAVYQPARLFYFSAIGAVVTMLALAYALSRSASTIAVNSRLATIAPRVRQMLSVPRRHESPKGDTAVGPQVSAGVTLASVLMIGVVLLSTMSLLAQHQQWRDYSWKQQRLLGQIMQQTGHIQDGTLVFVIDRSNGALNDYVPFNYVFEGAFQLVEDDYNLHARLCYDNASDPADTRYCHFSSQGITVPDIWAGGQGFTAPYNDAVGFVLNADGAVTLLNKIPPEFGASSGYAPASLFNVAAGPPARYYTMLTYPR